ncbi:Beta-lactamase [Pleurostoma richardsiae]|uniref:Beta-lactamase n=1 Tax=Pleurostoma richardsiae TaxID=41990 RepID=A0AA38S531_9PEZI|nr:Beta-lactamase [Pleurostoma richardsiae]
MSDFEKLVEKAVEDRTVPGVVLLAKDKSGKVNYSKAFGRRSLRPGYEEPLQTNDIYTLMSLSKLITTIAALQVVERGLISLDADLASHLPELAAQPVLRGFKPDSAPSDPSAAILGPRTKPITLRHLLTHSSGLGYPFLSPTLGRYCAAAGLETGLASGAPSVEAQFLYPLLFEPGEGFTYGSGLDWAGRLIERLTGLDLESYLAANVFAPLGIKDATFYPERRPDLTPRLVDLATRDPATGKIVPTPGEKPQVPAPAKAAFGGQGLCADLNDYLLVLESLLRDDRRLLRPETAALMFQPQLEPKAREACLKTFEDPSWAVGSVPPTGEYDWALGGLLVDGDAHEYRQNGCLLWGGLYNIAWFVDRKAGVAGIIGAQMVPTADPEVEKLIVAFEKEVYSMAK